MVSKAKFVSLKDGQSKIVFRVTADKRGAKIGEIKLALQNPLQQVSVAEIVVEALDAKTKVKKRAVFNPRALNPANPIPAVIVLGNLMLLKPLRDLQTDKLSIRIRKVPKSKLSVRLTVKICKKPTTGNFVTVSLQVQIRMQSFNFSTINNKYNNTCSDIDDNAW